MGKTREASPPEEEEIARTKLKKKKDRIQKKKQKEEELGLYSRDDLDLDRETYPIAHFIGDKKGMIEEIFSVVNGARLQAMLPPVLKPLPLSDLKQLCLQQFSRLSAKKIQAILAGHELGPGLSSESEAESLSESSDSVASFLQTKKRKKKVKERKRKKKKEVKEKRAAEKEENDSKTLMELLELEMRAKAIKALLENETKNKTATDIETNVDIKTEVDEENAMEENTKLKIADENTVETISAPLADDKKIDIVSHESSEEEIGEIRTGDANKGTIRWISKETKKVKQKQRRREISKKTEKTRRQYRRRGPTLSTPSLSSEEEEERDLSEINHTILAANGDQIENIESEEGEFWSDENDERDRISGCRPDIEKVDSESEETMDEDYDVHVESPSSDEKEDSFKEVPASIDQFNHKEVKKSNNKGKTGGSLSSYALHENAKSVKAEETINQINQPNATNIKVEQAVDREKSSNEEHFSDESNSSDSALSSTGRLVSLDGRDEEELNIHQEKEDGRKSKDQSAKQGTICQSEIQGVENKEIFDGRNTEAQNLNEIVTKGSNLKNEDLKREEGKCAQKEASIHDTGKINKKETILDDKKANKEILDDYRKGENKNAKGKNKEMADGDEGYVNDKQPDALEDKQSGEKISDHRKVEGTIAIKQKEKERAQGSVVIIDDTKVECEGKKDEATLKDKEENEWCASAGDDGFWKGDYDDIDMEEEVREEDILNDFNFNTDSEPVVVEYTVERPLTKFTFQSAKRTVPNKGRLKRINFGSSRNESLDKSVVKNLQFIESIKESKECVAEEGKELKEITIETTQKSVPSSFPKAHLVPKASESNVKKMKSPSTEESWKSRYVTSDKVQKIVETTKIMSKVRSKIKEKVTKEVEKEEKNLEEDKTVVIGTLEEYERISGKKVGMTAEIIEDNEEEDEEESALWSDIFGK